MSRAAPSISKAQSGGKFRPAHGGNAHGGKRKLLEGKAALLEKLISRKDGVEHQLKLAQIHTSLEQWGRAKDALDRCLQLDPADALCARHLLAPLLLNLGEHDAAAKLFVEWREDTSAAMLIGQLLLALALWDGEDATEEACDNAFARAVETNWHAVLLLGAVSSGDSPLPESMIEALREQRVEALQKRAGGGASSSSSSSSSSSAAASWPSAGGVQEAMLVSEAYAGFAGSEVDEEDAWPGLEGADVWLSHKTLEADPPLPPKATPKPSDTKKEVRLFDEKREEMVEELENIILEAEAEEEEEGEEGGEEGGEEEGEEGENGE
jgi:hypothetical protein